jgi:hypothetical protein
VNALRELRTDVAGGSDDTHIVRRALVAPGVASFLAPLGLDAHADRVIQ